MARAEALSLHTLSRTVPNTNSTSSTTALTTGSNRKAGYQSITQGDDEEEARFDTIQTSNWIVGTRKYEMTELCEIFLGTRGMQLFSLVLAIYLYGSLWAYATVFANSLTANFPLDDSYSYNVYLLLFTLCVLPTSCLELAEQVTLQMIYSACRVLMVVFMTSTVAVAYYRTGTTYQPSSFLDEAETSNPFDPTSSQDSVDEALASPSSSSSLWKWNGLHIILPIALFANIFHHSIPSLSEPVRNKQSLHLIFLVTLLACSLAYTLIGVILTLYFGDAIRSSSNLNWMDYDGQRTFQEISTNYRVLAVQILSSFIIVFPAVDVASAFPLCAITLGNNLQTAFSFQKTSRGGGGGGVVTETSVIAERRRVIFFRLAAAIPPIIGAMFVKDLGTITDYTGQLLSLLRSLSLHSLSDSLSPQVSPVSCSCSSSPPCSLTFRS
jgi:amino acid permease